MEKHETAWLVLALRGLSCPSTEVIKEEARDRSKGIMLLRCRFMQILYHCKCLCVRDVRSENHLRQSRLDAATWGVVVREIVICILMTTAILRSCDAPPFANKTHELLQMCEEKDGFLLGFTDVSACTSRRNIQVWLYRSIQRSFTFITTALNCVTTLS